MSNQAKKSDITRINRVDEISAIIPVGDTNKAI